MPLIEAVTRHPAQCLWTNVPAHSGDTFCSSSMTFIVKEHLSYNSIMTEASNIYQTITAFRHSHRVSQKKRIPKRHINTSYICFKYG